MSGAPVFSATRRHAREGPPKERLPGSLAAALAAPDQGVHILRIHDVTESRQAVAVWDRLCA